VIKLTTLIFLLFQSSLIWSTEYIRPTTYAQASVVIDAPIEDVWEYNSHNEFARDWSVYFYKIVSCPDEFCPENALLQPSDVGFTRRSFRQENEEGVRWDETTIKITKSESKYYKQIRAFNFHGYPKILGVNINNGEFLVEQFLEHVGDNKTKITFRAGLIKRNQLEKRVGRIQYFSWKNGFKFFTKKTVARLFKENLVNIKVAIELGSNYKRVYPYIKSK
jgi:hypothetical protein